MRSSRSAIATLFLLGATHCAGPPTSPNAVREHIIRPSEANDAISTFDEPHYIWVPTSSPSGECRMMLLLAGTGGQPAHAQLIGRVAALQGYSVVALMYPNVLAVVTACASDPAPRREPSPPSF